VQVAKDNNSEIGKHPYKELSAQAKQNTLTAAAKKTEK